MAINMTRQQALKELVIIIGAVAVTSIIETAVEIDDRHAAAEARTAPGEHVPHAEAEPAKKSPFVTNGKYAHIVLGWSLALLAVRFCHGNVLVMDEEAPEPAPSDGPAAALSLDALKATLK